MGIRTDTSNYDMSAWVSEKSFNALDEACALAEWLHKNAASLGEEEVDRLSHHTFYLLRNVAVLYAFSHENTPAFGPQWVTLLFAQGRLRLPEYSRLVTGKVPLDTPPLEYPESIQKVVDLFAEAVDYLRNSASVSLVRSKVTELGESLLKSWPDSLLGKKILDLVDRQSYYNAMSWAEFVSECSTVIDRAQERFLEAHSHYRWAPSEPEASDEWDI